MRTLRHLPASAGGALALALGLISLGVGQAGSLDDLPLARPERGDWPWWRGPSRDNKAAGLHPPLRWSPTNGVIWKAPVPGPAHASPILWGEQVFVAAVEEAAQVQRLVCLNRRNGTEVWSKEIQRGGWMKKHDKNSQASATPACDGERVFFASVFDGALWVTAVAMADGARIWQQRVGDFVPSNGYGSSPICYKSAVIVLSDSVGDACLIALHRKTGQVLWKTQRPRLDNFCTPTLGRTSGRDQLLVCGSRMMAGYDPDTGQRRWWVESPTEVTACTVAFDERFAVGGGNVPVREFQCVATDGTGDVTASRLNWSSRKNVTYVPSPLIDRGLLYFVNDGGIMHCLEVASGVEVWKERLEGSFCSSPLLIDEKLFVTNEAGRTYVLRSGREFACLGTNDLAEPVLASFAASVGRWYARSGQSVWCIGEAVE